MTRAIAASVSVLSLILALTGTALSSAASAEEILIGTGSTQGVYYQLGRAICRLVNRGVKDVTCKPLSTAGSLFNLSNVRSGAIEIGIAQSDTQFYAVKHAGPFQFRDDTYEDLRALFSVHSEPFTLVARRDSGIRRLDD
ncbi:MAG: TAXI family TRAP transporter solute-binding subunit, partial [Acidiferrobacterales bacterium]